MHQKPQEQNDYLQSLFLKPFCNQFFRQTDSNNQSSTLDHQSVLFKPNKKQKGDPKINELSLKSQPSIRKNSINTKGRSKNIRSDLGQQKLTPYQSRKNQQKKLSIQIGKCSKPKSHNLEQSKSDWLIINEIKSNMKRIHRQILKDYAEKRQQIKTDNLKLLSQPQTNFNQQSLNNIRIYRSNRNNSSQNMQSQCNSNIRTIMSYYRNRKAIKNLSNLSFNSSKLTNQSIKESVNLCIQTTKDKKQSNNYQQPKYRYRTQKRKISDLKRGKNQSISQLCNQQQIKTTKMNDTPNSKIERQKLRSILKSGRIGLSLRKIQSNTEKCNKNIQKKAPSKILHRIDTNKSLQMSAWQNGHQKQRDDYICTGL